MDHNSRQQLEIIVQMIQNILDSSLQTESAVSVMPVINNTVKTKSKKPAGTNTTKKNPAKQRPNAFESMPEMHMHKEDVEIDKKLARVNGDRVGTEPPLFIVNWDPLTNVSFSMFLFFFLVLLVFPFLLYSFSQIGP